MTKTKWQITGYGQVGAGGSFQAGDFRRSTVAAKAVALLSAGQGAELARLVRRCRHLRLHGRDGSSEWLLSYRSAILATTRVCQSPGGPDYGPVVECEVGGVK